LKTVNLSNKAWLTLVRLAVATIWAYAGIFEKLLNPGFLNPASTSYVGITVKYLA
jgi:thiosulfate dehydrogenase [quinone] large subunit